MTPRERRERLLKNRPFVRRFDIHNLNDIGIVWADYQRGNFLLPAGLDNDQFKRALIDLLLVFDSIWFVEDSSHAYSSNKGPTALIGIRSDGWKVEPLFHHFKWATQRNRFRAVVATLQMLRYSRDVGVCVYYAPESQKPFCDHLKEYGVLFPSGKVLHGRPEGAAYVYSVKGKKEMYASVS